MSQDPRSRTASGPGDTGLVERAEALLDEAVGQAAKGSYGEAADKVQQALAIDPDNAVARDLLESYRRHVAGDDERRRRRRSIAAAAAAIEEMVENERLEEASAATEALAMQFGLDAPVEELRRSISEARAVQLDFHDLDAAIEAIRLPTEGGREPAGRTDAGGSVVAQIEEHLRSGRLDEAERALARLESEPDSEDRARKLRTRIAEALEVAAEHRREEEILIATAAIEERLRRGNIDDAAQRLTELEERHGSSAPVAELRERLAEARALVHRGGGQAGAVADPDGGGPIADHSEPASPVWQSMIEEESRGGRSRWIAIAVVVAIVLGGLWWWSQRSPTQTGDSATGDAPAAVGGATGAPPDATSGAATSGPADAPATSELAIGRSGDAAQSTGAVDPRSARSSSPAVVESRAAARESKPAASTSSVVAPPIAAQERVAPPNDAGAADTTADRAAQAALPESPSGAISESAAPAAATDDATQVVVEAVPVSEAPPPEPAPPPVEPAIESPNASDAPAAIDDTVAAAPADPPVPARAEETQPVPPPAESQQAAAAPARQAPPPAAAPASTGPAMLGCGEAGVVCLKAVNVPAPAYPAAARARRLSASVVVMALVDERGRVIQTRIDSGSFPFFNEAATNAAERATFQPATRQGVPGRSWARLTFNFDQQ
ncbi:MAG TPA: TonB family protein [Thermoanaerobaculia bacterium]|nr:TonB family protein [Thermoanaerobaculia bacterium]